MEQKRWALHYHEVTHPNQLDCLIIGGGPAGLTAAIYLARFHRKVLVVDEGKSRAALIPESHNYPGFVGGVSGPALLSRLREQAKEYGVHIEAQRVQSLERDDNGSFIARASGGVQNAPRVLLATGIVDETPDLAGLRNAIYRGVLRFCPICDGYEATDRRIGVLGHARTAFEKAMFLRTYSRDVILLPTDSPAGLTPEHREVLDNAEIILPQSAVVDIERRGDRVAVLLSDGQRIEVDVLYPALGCEVRSELAMGLGVRTNESGFVYVDDHQGTSVEGLYAAGDVVTDLHQISVATGHAAIAAAHIHKTLPRNFR